MGITRTVSILSILVLAVAACYTGQDLDRLPEGQFWAQDLTDNSWYVVDAPLAFTGTFCKVYVETDSIDGDPAAVAAAVAAEFDGYVYSAVRNNFGFESDVDGDGRITIVIMDIIDDYTPGGTYVAGYFSAINEFEAVAWQAQRRYSNERDMLYMDCSPTDVSSEIFRLTLAHEFQHMVNFNQKVFVQGSMGQDTWINEGLSNAAEYVYRLERGEVGAGAHVAQKVIDYNSSPLIAQGWSFLSWWGDYDNYVAAYLFFQWLRIHSTDGIGIYKAILDNPNEDYRAVEQEAGDVAAKVLPFETGDTDWKRLVRGWYIANLFYDSDPSIYGYRGDLPMATVPPRVDIHLEDGRTFDLAPGEGVYATMTSPHSVASAGTIDYSGLAEDTSAVDNQGGEYSGTTLLAYNYDGQDTKALTETGSLPSVAASRSAYESAITRGRGPRPVDALVDHRGGSSHRQARAAEPTGLIAKRRRAERP